MRTGIIIQARLGSKRLPGKVLKQLPYGSGDSVLQHVIKRLKLSEKADVIIVATTVKLADDPIVELAAKEGVLCFRGAEDDVLERYFMAAEENNLDLIVRVTSDCPCIDPEVLDRIIDEHKSGGNDYTSNTMPRTYPHGLDVEVFTFEALKRAHDEAVDAYDREHVTPYLYRYGKFETGKVAATGDMARPDIRVTLDTIEDYALLSAVFDCLYDENPFFGGGAIVRLFNEKPWLAIINGKIVQKSLTVSREDEVAEAIRLLELQGLDRAADALRKA